MSSTENDADGHAGDGHDDEQQRERLDLYRYATADNAREYVAVMRRFADTLLADLSAAEVAAAVAEDGISLSADEVELRCRQLVAWGNLVRSVRDPRVATVAEFMRARSRYQVSPLGGRVHRQVEDLLAASSGAREVARELLGTTVATLDRMLALLRAGLSGPGDVDTLAGEVTTVFANQRLFRESVTEFYHYLGEQLNRYDLAGPDYTQFKKMLLDYLDLIAADVAQHAPAVSDRLEQLTAHEPAMLAALARTLTLTGPDGAPVERLPGRSAEDWGELRDWYSGRTGRSGPDQLRSAAQVALNQLIANAKRMLAASGTGLSRRQDLLKLAGWFAASDADQAHRLFAATFGSYPARHLCFGPEEHDPRIGPGTSWWAADPVDVPLSLRERGDRSARGRTSPVPDPGLAREEMLAQARAETDRKQAAARELAAAGALDGAQLTPAARDLLLDRLGALLSVHQDLAEPVTAEDSDLNLALTLTPAPGQVTRVRSDDGDLRVDDLVLHAHALTDASAHQSGGHAAGEAAPVRVVGA